MILLYYEASWLLETTKKEKKKVLSKHFVQSNVYYTMFILDY